MDTDIPLDHKAKLSKKRKEEKCTFLLTFVLAKSKADLDLQVPQLKVLWNNEKQQQYFLFYYD
jgi:hypothetical protein